MQFESVFEGQKLLFRVTSELLHKIFNKLGLRIWYLGERHTLCEKHQKSQKSEGKTDHDGIYTLKLD